MPGDAGGLAGADVRVAPTRGMWWLFGVDCVLATTVRLLLAAATSGYATDVQIFQSWAETLRDHPLERFYATAHLPDHLPGDLWLLKGAESAYGALGGHDLDGRGFTFVLQVVPTLGDLLTATMVLLIARGLAGPRVASTCARWYLLNPATIILTGVWGQWDSVSLGILFTGVWLLLRQDRAWVVSGVFLAWAVLIKPPLAVVVLCLLPLVWRHWAVHQERGTQKTRVRVERSGELVMWVVSLFVTAYALLTPFSVHLVHAPPGGSTLADRLAKALDLYPFTTLGAANIWMLPIRSLDRVRDDVPGLLGLTDHQWGELLLVGVLVLVLAPGLVRLAGSDVVTRTTWTAAVALLAGFLLPTRVHERYALPVLGFALLLLAARSIDGRLDPRLVVWFWWLSACLGLNQFLVLFGGLHLRGSLRYSFDGNWWLGLTLAYVAGSLALFTWPWWRRERQPTAGVSSST